MSMTAETPRTQKTLAQIIARTRTLSLVVGVVALGVCAVSLAFSPRMFFESYLVGYVFCWELAVGGLGLMLLHQLVGGAWGQVTRPVFAAASGTFWLLAVLVLPILVGMKHLYPWTNSDYVAGHHHLMESKAWWLNEPRFVIAAAGYFAVWLLWSFVMNRQTARRIREGGVPASVGLKGFSGAGLLLLFLTATFAAFDWAMTLDPTWYSTMFGGVLIIGGAVGTFSLAIAWAVLTPLRLSGPAGTADGSDPDTRNDLGSLLLAFILLWTYFNLSQYLIIWSGNLPAEVSWYVDRTRHGWLFVSYALTVLQFVVPFFCLLSRDFKRNHALLGCLAVGMLVVRLIDVYWTIVPSFDREGFALKWTDPLAVVGLFGLWTAALLWQLPRFLPQSALDAVPAHTPQPTHHGH
jgi:hypothetical protein